MTNSSSEVAKANTAPAATPGQMRGSSTRRNAIAGGAPSEAAARSRLASKVARLASTLTTTNGTATTV